MCEVRVLDNSRRCINVILKTGETYKSAPFVDNSNPIENNINCTEKERAILNSLCKQNGFKETDISEWYISRERNCDGIYISDHAFKRLKERNGWNRKTSVRMLKKIYDEGKREDELTGQLATWINAKKEEQEEYNTYIVYGDYLYVFAYNTLVTVYQTPRKGSYYNPFYKKEKRACRMAA